MCAAEEKGYKYFGVFVKPQDAVAAQWVPGMKFIPREAPLVQSLCGLALSPVSMSLLDPQKISRCLLTHVWFHLWLQVFLMFSLRLLKTSAGTLVHRHVFRSIMNKDRSLLFKIQVSVVAVNFSFSNNTFFSWRRSFYPLT